jgi:AcrR family transcriptional regulator
MEMAKGHEGLRERKKRATREAIATAARRLFAERGFDRVTVAEVAVAADVSEKTVFNHFATKEDLAFAGGLTGLDELPAALARRPAGASVLDVFRAATDALLDGVADPGDDDALPALARIVHRSDALRERLATGSERETATLAAAIADAVGADAEDVVPALVARTLAWTHRSIVGAAVAGLSAGEDRRALAARLRAAATRAYDQVGAGLSDYGTRERDAAPVASAPR